MNSDKRILAFFDPQVASTFFQHERESQRGNRNRKQDGKGGRNGNGPESRNFKGHEKGKKTTRKNDRHRDERERNDRYRVERERNDRHRDERGKKSIYDRLGPKPQKIKCPAWNNCSLIGDSIMVRIAEQLEASPKSSSLCIGGLTTRRAKELVDQVIDLKPTVVMLLGINDIFENYSKHAVVKNIIEILAALLSKNVSKILLIELLPIAKLRNRSYLNALLHVNAAMNKFEVDGLHIINVHEIFMKKEGERLYPDMELYERPANRKRANLVHPNRVGVKKIVDALKSALPDLETQQ